MKFVTVAGSRAQAIALSQVSRQIRRSHQEIFVFCAPVDDLSADSLWEANGLELARPRHQWVARAATPGRRAADLMMRLERVIRRERPDVVLVHGGGDVAMAGVLVAAQLHFASAHMESGLRAPQVCAADDVNRRVADRLAAFRFCATAAGAACLEREGIREGVHAVGDPTLEALAAAQAGADLPEAAAEKLGLRAGGYCLAVVSLPERRKGADKLAAWLAALGRLRLPVAALLHPRATLVMHEANISLSAELRVLEVLDLPEMLAVERGAKVIVTDSASVQREAIFLGVPCVAMGEPAWPEAGRVVGAEPAALATAIERAASLSGSEHPFGDGHASERIVEILSGGTSPTFGLAGKPAAPREG